MNFWIFLQSDFEHVPKSIHHMEFLKYFTKTKTFLLNQKLCMQSFNAWQTQMAKKSTEIKRCQNSNQKAKF